MSDRDLLLAIAMALGGLAEKLTGCSLQIRVPKEDGTYQKIILSGASVEWVPTNACSELLDRHAVWPEHHSTPAEADCGARSSH
jgi:hypothetical protein